MIFYFMKNHSQDHCIEIMAKVFKVSRSGYYAWFRRNASSRDVQNRLLTLWIKEYQQESKQSYGAKRLTHVIKERKKIPLGHNRIARLMKLHGLNAVRTRKWRKPKELKELSCTISNVLDRNFSVDKPNRVWVSDITYIKTTCGWRYH
jgi:transposase InsO family protein